MPGRDLKLLAMMRNCLEMVGSRARPSRCSTGSAASLRQHLPDGAPTLEAISATLRTTPAAIRRALADEGLSLREAIDAVRFEMARHYLPQRHLP